MKRTAGIIFRSILLILAGVIIGLLIGDNDFSGHTLGLPFSGNDKLEKVLQLVRQNYVDSVNIDSVEGVTANNLLQNLDPHSMYLPKQQEAAINEKLDGGFDGFGIEYLVLRDTLVITQTYAGGPAASAGLVSGDKVLDINNKKFSGTHLTDDRVDSAFADNKSNIITLKVLDPGDTIKSYSIKRGHIDVSSLDASYMAAPGIGYIKISKFASNTDNDFKTDLRKLKEQGMTKLILDIRGNGGGYLNTATALADEFLTKGKLIVYTEGIHEPRTDYFATDSGDFQQGKLAVLIDEYSASASEILAGALQDLDRAVIIGRRSFGKGLVQQQFPFDDGSAVNLTVARYYTPSGRSIQKSYADGIKSYHNELAERMKKGELFSAQSNLNDSIFKKAQPYYTADGKKVFGGGGIMPDIFVPEDSTRDTYLVQQLSDSSLFTAYVIDKMQPILRNFSSAGQFIKQYAVSDSAYADFIAYSSKTLKEMDPDDIRVSKDYIKNLLKAYAADFKWGDEAYFQTLNTDDPTFKVAVNTLSQGLRE